MIGLHAWQVSNCFLHVDCMMAAFSSTLSKHPCTGVKEVKRCALYYEHVPLHLLNSIFTKNLNFTHSHPLKNTISGITMLD